MTVTAIEPTGDAATVRGREQRRVEMKQGTPQSVDLAVLFTLSRGPDGRWLIVKREYR